jgi:hypothetical protein
MILLGHSVVIALPLGEAHYPVGDSSRAAPFCKQNDV